MERVLEILAAKRLAKWPREWQRMIVDLPMTEGLVVVELVARLDARPHGHEAGKTE